MTPLESTATPLEQILIRRGVLDPSAVSKLRLLGVHPFHEVATKLADTINESAWLEAVASESGFPPTWPAGDPNSLPAENWKSPEWLEKGAVLLRTSPVPLVGVIDPAVEGEVLAVIQNASVQSAPEIRLISPHFLASVRASHGGSWQGSESFRDPAFRTEEWARQCGFQDINSEADIIAAFHLLGIDTLPDGYIMTAASAPSLPIWIVCETNTRAWIASARVNDPELAERGLQHLGKSILRFAISPWEEHRLEGLARKAVIELRVPKRTRWEISASWNSTEIGRNLYQQIIESAAAVGASDIHVEPAIGRSRIRFRILGVMVEQPPLDLAYARDFLRRVKVQSALRHDCLRMIQSGSAEFVRPDGERLDLRTELAPPKGDEETAVIRLLNRRLPDLDDIRMDSKSRTAIDWFLPQETGMMVLSGPTGSGKTTTIYACLNALDRPDQKIITIEDPVEKRLAGAVQYEIDEPQGISFSTLIRSVVRQDPDVLMVQEMRDRESAQAAVDCAISGTQVFTTTHANDCAGVINRMCGSFRMDRATVAFATKLILAQRLVRRLCQCKRVTDATPEELRFFGNAYDGSETPLSAKRMGCPLCHGSGYCERFAVAEVMIVDQPIRELIEHNEPAHVLRKANQARGFKTLPEIAASLAFAGEIEITEARAFLPDLPL